MDAPFPDKCQDGLIKLTQAVEPAGVHGPHGLNAAHKDLPVPVHDKGLSWCRLLAAYVHEARRHMGKALVVVSHLYKPRLFHHELAQCPVRCYLQDCLREQEAQRAIRPELTEALPKKQGKRFLFRCPSSPIPPCPSRAPGRIAHNDVEGLVKYLMVLCRAFALQVIKTINPWHKLRAGKLQ